MGKKICYRELNGLVNRFARALEALGVKKGDTVAVMLPNIPQAVIANYAVFRIGAVAAQNNPLYTERELTYQLADSDAKVLVTLTSCSPQGRRSERDENRNHHHLPHNDYLPFPKKQLFPYVKRMYRKVVRQPGVPVHGPPGTIPAIRYSIRPRVVRSSIPGHHGCGKGDATHANIVQRSAAQMVSPISRKAVRA